MHFKPYYEFFMKNRDKKAEIKWSYFLNDYCEFNRRLLYSKLLTAFLFFSYVRLHLVYFFRLKTRRLSSESSMREFTKQRRTMSRQARKMT
jgi:hypothetical protein